MIKSLLKTAIAAAAVAAIAGTATAAISSISSDPNATISNLQALPAGSDHPMARAGGADLTKMEAIGKTSTGDTVSIAPTQLGRCVLFSTQDDFCVTDDQVPAGRSVQITNDCGQAQGPMRIAAVLSDGAASATLNFSDGTSTAMRTAHGVAWFSGHVPAPAGRYATSISVADGTGKPLAGIDVPIGPAGYCPGA
jgi:hypothetical protein